MRDESLEKRIGFTKTALIVTAAIGINYLVNNAYAGNAYDTKTGKAAIVTQSGSSQIGLTPNDIIIFQNRQNIGVDSKGNTYIRQGPSIAEAAEEMKRQETQQTKTQKDYETLIKKDPTNAALYIAKADELVKNKAPPEEIIPIYEMGLSHAKADERIQLHQRLSAQYEYLGNNKKSQNKKQEAVLYYKESLTHLQSIKRLDPNYRYIDWSIEQLTKKSQGKI